MEMFEALSPVIVQALSIIILALAGVFGRWAATWARNKGLNELIETHEKWAAVAVRTAKDIYGAGDGDVKLSYACGWLSARLKERGIKFNPEEIEGLVRSAYQEIIGEWEEVKSHTSE